MTRKTKKILFYASVFLFIVLSFSISLYAQGYKYSLKEGKFVLTGAISVKVNVDANVFINGKPEGETSFLGNSFGINRLVPGDYKITISRDGYSSWNKTATVGEGFVSDFSNVLIFPTQGLEKEKLLVSFEEIFSELELLKATPTPTPTPKKTPKPSGSPSPSPSPSPFEDPFILKDKKLYKNTEGHLLEIATNVLDFSLSNNGHKIAWWNNYEIWVMWLVDTNYQPFMKNGQIESVTRFSVPINLATWYKGDNHLLIRFGKTKPHAYQIVEIDKRGGVNLVGF